MFESITKKRKNPIINFVGWSLLVIVCIIFVFIGFSPNSNFLGSGGAAAEVNGDAISLREFKDLVDRMGNQNPSSNSDARKRMQENALNMLIESALITQEAEKLNIYVSDKEVADTLLNIEFFKDDGQFSRLRYKTYLQQARFTESEFENRIRRDLIIQKMTKIIGFTVKDSEMMENFDQKIDQAKVNVSYLRISAGQLANQARLTGTELTKYIESHKKKVEDYFAKNKKDFKEKEQVKARHIPLVKAKDEKPESMKKALDKMNKVVKETTVANFSAMAKKYSDDPGSKARGGDLGFFPRGRMVPEFEKAAFEGEKGKISEPVKTKYGYHIILVDDKKEAQEPELASAQDKIANILYREEVYDKVLTEIREKLKSNDYEAINTVAQKNNLRWKDTGFFSITQDAIPGIGKNKPFSDAVMALSKDQPYSKNLVHKGQTSYLIKFKEAKIDTAQKANAQMDFLSSL